MKRISNLIEDSNQIKVQKKKIFELLFEEEFNLDNNKNIILHQILLNFLHKNNLSNQIENNKILTTDEIKFILFNLANNTQFKSFEQLEINSNLVEELKNHIISFKENNIDLKSFFELEFESNLNKQDLFEIYSKFELFKKKKKLYDKFDIYNVFHQYLKKEKFKTYSLEELKNNLIKKNILIKSNYNKREKEIIKILDLNNLIENTTSNKIISKEIRGISCNSYSQLKEEILHKLLEFSNSKENVFFSVEKDELKEIIIDIARENKINISSNCNFSKSYFSNLILDILKIIIDPKNSTIELVSLLEFLNIDKKTISYLLRKKDLKERDLFSIIIKSKKLSQNNSEQEYLEKIKKDILNLVNLHHSKISILKIITQIFENLAIFNILISNNQDIDFSEVKFFIELFYSYQKIDNRKNLEHFFNFCQNQIKLKINFKSNSKNIYIGSIYNYSNQKNIIIPFSNEFSFLNSFKKDKFLTTFSLNKKKYFDSLHKYYFNILNSDVNILVLKDENQNLDSFFNQFEVKFENSNLKSNFEISTKEKVKNEIISKILKYIQYNQFNLAKNELNLLETLYSDKKDLTNFININHPQFDFYKNMLKNKSKTYFDFDYKKQIYSVSQLKTFQNCPKKYEFQYIYKIPSESKHYFDFGTSIHSVLEEILPLFFKNFSSEEIFSKALNSLSKNWISSAYISSKQEIEYFEKGISLIKNFIEKQSVLKLKQETLFLEKEFNIEIYGKSFIGFIDRIDKEEEGFKVIDYKTSNSCSNKEELKKDLQLYIYAKALKKIIGEYPKSMGLWYLNFNKIEEIDFNEFDLKKINIEIKEILDKIEKLEFTPNPSKFNCSFCDYQKICSSKFNM